MLINFLVQINQELKVNLVWSIITNSSSHPPNQQQMIFFKLYASSQSFFANNISRLHAFRCRNLFGTSKKLFGQQGLHKLKEKPQQENLRKSNTPLINIQTTLTSNPILQHQNKQQKPANQQKPPLQSPTKSKKSSFLSSSKKSHQQRKLQPVSARPPVTPTTAKEEYKQQLINKQLIYNEHKKPKWVNKQFTHERTNKHSYSPSSFNLRSCEMMLHQFKDIAKQSKNVKSLIGSFNEYMIKLREHQVEQTQLKQKYKPIMYSAMMRMFARILRRQNHPNRTQMIQFVGINYQSLRILRLDCLRTLEISDFVSFFFLFQLMSQFRNVSEEKKKVVERYLVELHERYCERREMKAEENQKELVDEERMEKRYLSELILASRCAQLFASSTYPLYLTLLLQHITTKQLVPYKMVSILKFILRGDTQLHQISPQSYPKQLALLYKIIQKIQECNGSQLQQMDEVSLRQFYCNLVSIYNNNSHKGDLTRVTNTLAIVQGYIISILHNLTADQVNIIFSYSLISHSQHYKLAKFIYSSILNNINLNGQTSLNPLFVLMMLANVNQHQVVGFNGYELWEEKVVQMIKRYLIRKDGEQKKMDNNNLSYCGEYVARLVKTLPMSSKLYNTLINAIINRSLIIPYDHQTLTIENHYLNLPNYNQLKLATLYRLKNAHSNNNKKTDFYQNIFNQLESTITQQQKKDVFEKHKQYIQEMGQIKRNRQGYVRMISKLCITMKKQHLIADLFSESLSQIINFDSQGPQIFKSHSSTNTKPKPLIIPQDLRVKDKIYALLSNYVNIMYELKPNIIQELLAKHDGEQETIDRSDKFVSTVKSNPQINKILLDVLASKQSSTLSFTNKYNAQNKNIHS